MSLSPQKTSPNARSTAAQVLTAVLKKGRSLDNALEEYSTVLSDKRDLRLTKALCYGVLRELPYLQSLLRPLLYKPLKSSDQDIEALLWIGLYQHLYLRTPQYAAISASADAARQLCKPWAVSLINGVLREFLRRQSELIERPGKKLAEKLRYPKWWLKLIEQDWPNDWQEIAHANNCPPPMTLRVNTQQVTCGRYWAMLQEVGVNADFHPQAPQALVLDTPQEVWSLPSFEKGYVSVQDAAAQQAAPLLKVQDGMRVLDACAAPGGKTSHIWELTPSAEIVAIDNNPKRIPVLRTTLERLCVGAAIHCADAAQPKTWWDGELFDRILLDAPCSGSGVIRRHPDIKYLRRPNDIPRLADCQARLLDALWPLLAVGGLLLYVTCSILAIENHQQINSFLARRSNAESSPITASWGRELSIGRQTAPGEDGMDGFYYACLHKR